MRMRFIWKVVLATLVIGLGVGGYFGWDIYQAIYQPNVTLHGAESTYFYIPTGSTIKDVTASLYEQNYILNRDQFEWVAEEKNYQNSVRPGRYELTEGMTNVELIDLLRSGKQSEIKLVFNNVRTLEQLAGKIGSQIEPDSAQLISAFRDPATLEKYGFRTATFPAMFIPETYFVFWNTSAEQFLARMAREFKEFWTDERKGKARNLGLQQSEVSTLASILQEETNHPDDAPIIAGVYLNRIKKGMPLQADPTLKFALGDFAIRRVLNKDKKIDSPYNTYMYAGLPPGPIRLPDTRFIDAVLDYDQHNYLYFCASEKLDGRTNFAKTYQQHLVNARKYQRALNNRGIYR